MSHLIVNITTKEQKMIKFVIDQFPNYYKNREDVIADGIKMLYKDTLDKANQGNEYEGLPLIKSII